MKDVREAKQKPYSSKDKKGRLLAGAAIGATKDYLERASELIKHGVDCILIDIAHFHSIVGQKAVENFRAQFCDFELICGNVATYKGALFALELGADAVKVGIGPGKGCRTRLETGFGVPQLQAIGEAYLAVGGRIPIIADGGFEHDGQISMTIAAGASTVMLGSMLAGTDESPGMVTEHPHTKQKVKTYRGMTSPQAVIDRFSDEDDIADALKTPAEGEMKEVPYIGSVSGILERIAGHLISSVSFSGQPDLWSAHKEIANNPDKYFINLSAAARKESFER